MRCSSEKYKEAYNLKYVNTFLVSVHKVHANKSYFFLLPSFFTVLFSKYTTMESKLLRSACWSANSNNKSSASFLSVSGTRKLVVFVSFKLKLKKLSLTKLERHLYTFCKTVFYYVFVKLLNCKVDCFKEKLVILTVYSFFSEIYSTSYLLVENINWSQTFEF